MSRGCKPKHGQFGSDIHRLLQAAEAGQRADILAYSSGHLGPRSLLQSQPCEEKKQPFWSTSEKQREAPKPLTPQKRQTKAVRNNMKDYLAEVTADFTSLTIDRALASDHPTDFSFDAVPRGDICLNNLLPCMRKPLPKIQPKPAAPKKSKKTSSPRVRQYENDKGGLSKEEQMKISQVLVKHNVWTGTNAAEVHERKLEKELQKLSTQIWPSRDRLSVFSDVFDDVCESSPVFGRILREIKQTKVEQPMKPAHGTSESRSAKANSSIRAIHRSMRSFKNNYDLYANHMMSTLQNMPYQHSLKRLGQAPSPELEDKEEEVCLLEQQAREALQENRRLKNELQTIQTTCQEDKEMNDTSLSEQDSETADGCDTSVHSKKRHVLNVWTEILQLEEEIQGKLVSTDTTTAIERCIRALKNEIMKLIISSNQLEITNKDLENKINTVLHYAKIGKAMKQRLWDEFKTCEWESAVHMSRT